MVKKGSKLWALGRLLAFGVNVMRLIMALVIALVPITAMAKSECRDDKKKFCKDVFAAKGDVGACREQHLAELSEAGRIKQQTKSNKAAQKKDGTSGSGDPANAGSARSAD